MVGCAPWGLWSWVTCFLGAFVILTLVWRCVENAKDSFKAGTFDDLGTSYERMQVLTVPEILAGR